MCFAPRGSVHDRLEIVTNIDEKNPSLLACSVHGLQVFAAIEAITTVISKWSAYNKKIKEAQEESIKMRVHDAIPTCYRTSFTKIKKFSKRQDSHLQAVLVGLVLMVNI